MPVNQFPHADDTVDALRVMHQVALEHPEIPIGEYFEVYNPILASNECCYRCWKASHSACAWSRDFEAVEGSIYANLTRNNGCADVDAFKIFYCPEFQHDDQIPDEERAIGYDEDGCVNVLCAIAKEVADDYRYTLSEIKRLRILYNYQIGKGWDANKKKIEDTLAKLYAQLAHKKDIETNVMPAHCNAIQRQVGYKENKSVDSVAIRYIEGGKKKK